MQQLLVGSLSLSTREGECSSYWLVHFQWNFQSTCCARKSSRAEVILLVMSTGGKWLNFGVDVFFLRGGLHHQIARNANKFPPELRDHRHNYQSLSHRNQDHDHPNTHQLAPKENISTSLASWRHGCDGVDRMTG